jgi:hypothetical protein
MVKFFLTGWWTSWFVLFLFDKAMVCMALHFNSESQISELQIFERYFSASQNSEQTFCRSIKFLIGHIVELVVTEPYWTESTIFELQNVELIGLFFFSGPHALRGW